jgi:hypothetical protein
MRDGRHKRRTLPTLSPDRLAALEPADRKAFAAGAQQGRAGARR